MKEGLDPREYMTRGEWLCEALDLLERSLRVANRLGQPNRVKQLECTLFILKRLYSVNELMDLEGLLNVQEGGSLRRKPQFAAIPAAGNAATAQPNTAAGRDSGVSEQLP